MKIKDLIKHLETLDQEKELIIIATDPTGWDYGAVVDEYSIDESVIYPSEENGLIEYFEDEDDMDEDEYDENNEDEDDEDDEDDNGIECYVIRMDV
jgi:hypothetical protein